MSRCRPGASASLLLLFCFLSAVAGHVGAEDLRVGTSGDYPPFSRAGDGFDIEVARWLAGDLGQRLVWVPFHWPQLQRDVETGAFDIAMGGVTWRTGRDVVGWMSRAVAAGGPCVVGGRAPRRIAVNRGGILERWTRSRFPDRDVRAVDDNLALPALLRAGEVDAFVTDSFEVRHFRPGGEGVLCEPATDRKVYWVAPHRAEEIGPTLDRWLRDNESRLDELRRRHFGVAAPRDDVDHLVDLLARRLLYMPAVAAWKRQRGLPVEDLEREALVLDRAVEAAAAANLDADRLRRFFEVQIALAKAVQRRPGSGQVELDLVTEIRPALLRLGDRIIAALAQVAPIEPSHLTSARLVPLESLLTEPERDSLRRALLLQRRAGSAQRPEGKELR